MECSDLTPPPLTAAAGLCDLLNMPTRLLKSLDEQLLDAELHVLDLWLQLGSLVHDDGARDHRAAHTTRTAQGCNTNTM